MTIRQQQLKIDRSKMMQSSKTNKDIEALRAKECVEVTMQGNNIQTLSVEDLENRFQLQQHQPESVPQVFNHDHHLENKHTQVESKIPTARDI